MKTRKRDCYFLIESFLHHHPNYYVSVPRLMLILKYYKLSKEEITKAIDSLVKDEKMQPFRTVQNEKTGEEIQYYVTTASVPTIIDKEYSEIVQYQEKEAFYFSHDSNAKDDPKILTLIEEMGLEGYGIYWVLIEVLRDQANFMYPLDHLRSLANRYNCSIEKVRAVVSCYDLFLSTPDLNFYSESLIRRMAKKYMVRQKRSEAGKKGNNKRWGSQELQALKS